MVMVVSAAATVDLLRDYCLDLVDCLCCGDVELMPKMRRCRYPHCHAMVQVPDHYCAKHYDHEAPYRASRLRWARSHSKQYQHRYNTRTRYRDETKAKQYDFYRTKQWQSLRQQVLDRDHYVCVYCGRPNSNTVDHTVPIEYDPTKMTEVGNLVTVCRRCHHLKTQWEESYYGTGIHQKHKKVPEIQDIATIKSLMEENAQR